MSIIRILASPVILLASIYFYFTKVRSQKVILK